MSGEALQKGWVQNEGKQPTSFFALHLPASRFVRPVKRDLVQAPQTCAHLAELQCEIEREFACSFFPTSIWSCTRASERKLRAHGTSNRADTRACTHELRTRACRFFSSFSRRASSSFCSLIMSLTIFPSCRESYVRSINSSVFLSLERISCGWGRGGGESRDNGKEQNEASREHICASAPTCPV